MKRHVKASLIRINATVLRRICPYSPLLLVLALILTSADLVASNPQTLSVRQAIAQPIAVASFTTSTTNPVPMGWIVQIRGELQLKRRNSQDYRPAAAGTVLYQGDILKPAAGATVRVLCAANNITWPVPAGKPSGVSNGCPPPRALQPQCPNKDCPRGSIIANNPTIPYIVSPRKTVLLTDKPTLRWNAVSGAKMYTVRLRGEGKDYWTTQVSSTSVVYPGEPPLKPGVSYSLIVETDTGLSSLKEDVPVGFKLLDDNDRQQVRTEIDQLSKEELNEQEKALALAYLYIKHDLKAEAIATLEALVQNGSPTAAVERTLGELYEQVGVATIAESRYLKAIELTMTEDIEGQAVATDRLGGLYAAIGERDKAIQYLKLAIPKYEALGDNDRVLELKNQLAELDKEN